MLNKILIVDEDPLVLSYHRHILGGHFLFETAANAGEALDLLERSGPFSVILSDLCLPGSDGGEFLSQVETLCPGIVKIVLTASPCVKSVMRAVNENHVFGFFDKSCDPTELIRKIASGIALFRKRNATGLYPKHGLLTEEERLFLRTGTSSVPQKKLSFTPR